MGKIIFLIPVLALLLSCKSDNRQNSKEGIPTITVSIEPIRYFTEKIAGEHFKVVSMVPQGSSPETYDPTPNQLVKLAQSCAYLRIGHIGFEQTWMNRLEFNAPHLHIYDISQDIELIHEQPVEEAHKKSDNRIKHQHGGVEPHIWNSPANARIMANNILQFLCSIDNEHKAEYIERHKKLCQEIEETDRYIKEVLSYPGADRSFMIYHPALSYFARDYGLRQIAIEKGGKEPTTAQLKKLIDTCLQDSVRIIFVQPEFDRSNAELISQQTRTRIVPINPLAYNWKEEMIRTAESLLPAEYLLSIEN